MEPTICIVPSVKISNSLFQSGRELKSTTALPAVESGLIAANSISSLRKPPHQLNLPRRGTMRDLTLIKDIATTKSQNRGSMRSLINYCSGLFFRPLHMAVVPVKGIEPSTFALRMRCSTV